MSTGDARPSRDFSVIVPAHQAALLLPDTLDALSRSSLPRVRWELLVVDDASTDDTARVAARWADAVITLDGPPRGPGGARNAAAARASGTWLVFIDADVRVHPDTLERIATVVTEDPALVGVFGSYDDAPAEQGLLSEYRNLLHRYVHLRGAGDAETFWAGCGAIRRDAFEAVDGFDTARFPRPQIEDIELGYRLRDRGWRIRLDPSIQGTHLKRWRLWPMVRTDFRDRGLPWMRLLLERRGRTAPTLNTGRAEQLRVGLAGWAWRCSPQVCSSGRPPSRWPAWHCGCCWQLPTSRRTGGLPRSVGSDSRSGSFRSTSRTTQATPWRRPSAS
ncbi:MAG: glycosyltransferase family 2 protein [Gemmatimonadetes bacterium]|nr:glycosyltransferase family 2 protein [Gemmatimonadota bacterium]